jgi:hypothetical protein
MRIKISSTIALISVRLFWIVVAVVFLYSFDSYADPIKTRTSRSFIFLWPGQPAQDAQLNLNGPIVTDRPNFTDASTTVGRGTTQVELGYTYSYTGTSAPYESNHSYPEAALRHGTLFDWLELRLGQSLITSDASGDSTTNFSDTQLGVKIGVTPQFGALPELALVPRMTIPTGSGIDNSDRALPALNLLYSWSISTPLYLTGSTQIRRVDESTTDRVNTIWAQSAVIGSRINDLLGYYLEWFGILDATDQHVQLIDTGLTYRYSQDVQYDIRLGSRLDSSFGEDIFAGIGVSLRFVSLERK